MFHLTWKGMIGRRKESSLLLIVLVLSFLLSSALAIILPSTQAEAQLQRESSYGSWKLMLLERSSEECEALAQALSEQGAQCAVLPSVSLSSEGELISVMTPEAMALGNFQLLEGRLPETENEVLLVENQFAIGALPEVGEDITVRYVWSAEAAGAEAFEQQQRRLIEEAFDRGLTQMIPSRMEEYLAFVAGAKEAWLVDKDSIPYPYLTRDCLGRDEPVDPEDMTPEELEISIKTYLRTYVINFSESKDLTAKEPVLIPAEDFYFTALRTTTKLTLTGELYGELAGQTIQLTNAYTEVSANIPYTVCGILKAYEATWDTGGHDMPDAFLSTAGREKILRCIASAQEQVEDLEFYYDKNQRSSTLLISSPASVAMLYDEAVASESALAQPYWEQIRYSEDAWGGQDTTVEFHAWDPAANCEVYRKGYIDYAEDGTARYVYPDVLDENGQPFSFTDEELASPDFQFPGLERIRPTFEYPPLDEQYEKNEFATRVNTYAYPKETGASGTSSTVLNGILVLISACAVLVICVVQSKRRAHSLVLLRSIGLQPGQAAVMQLTEALLFLALSLLIGLPLGYLAASAALHRFYHISVLAFDTGFLLRSAIFGAFSLLLGLQLPLLYSLRLPLTGRASAAVRKLPKHGQLRRGSLFEMEHAAAKFNRRRSFLARLLCALGLLLALLTLLLSHFAFDDYRSNVGRSNMPDYVMTAPYAMRPRFLRQKVEEYAASDALGGTPARLDSYLAAENVTLADYEDSPVLSELSHTVRIAGMKEDNSILQELLAYTGPIDTKKLLSGEGCILLMPYYKDNRNGSQRYSSDPVDAYRYKTDDSIQTGDILSLSADTHHLTEREVVKETNHASVEVLAVLHEYPGIWLFGSGAAPGILISGQTLITEIYPNAAQSYSAEEIRWIPYNNLMHCEYCHGKTYFQFYSPDAEDHTATCWNLAEAEGLEMKNNFREKEERLAACQSQRVMTVLLGAAAVLLVMIILLFILSDMAEQELRRIGILRALGASRGAIRRTHWLLALREGLWAVLLANAAYALILLVCAFFETGFHTLSPAALVTTLTQGLLWQYPWSLHLCLCLAALVLITLLRVLPYHRLCQSSVIGTIKGLERGE